VLDQFKSTVLILDECSQATEPASLLPFRFGAIKALLVGDPMQLAPTLTVPSKVRTGLERTLFERLAEAGIDPILLRTQYRVRFYYYFFITVPYTKDRIGNLLLN